MLAAAVKKGSSKTKIIPAALVEAELQQAAEGGIEYLLIGEAGYPEQLVAISDAPPVLTVIGDTGLLEKRSIAVVGARNCSAGGLKFTHSVCRDLSVNGFAIVSGMARGIDTAAHQASLEEGTVACLAGGIDVIYPPENASLYDAIAKKGLLISEMPPGTKPLARHFPRRNRIVSGLAIGLLVVEAARKSGSLISARYAAEQGREVFAVPGSPLDPRAQGSNQLIKDGAALIQCADDIIAELNAMPLLRQDTRQITACPDRPDESVQMHMHTESWGKSLPRTAEKAVKSPGTSQKNLSQALEFLSPVPAHIDDIVRMSGIPAEKLLIEFTELELTGDIFRHAGGKYSRIPMKNE